MKKLMCAVAAVAAGVAFADTGIASANVVGYQNKALTFWDSIEEEEMDQGYSFITPTFRNVDGTGTTVQSIQLNSDMGTGDCFLSPMGYDGEYLDTEYCWMSKADAKYYPHITVSSGANGVWTIEDDDLEYRMPTTEEAALADGTMLQINGTTDTEVQFNGSVSDAEVVFPIDFSEEGEENGYRFIGNPYPADMSLQKFQMSSGVGTGDAYISRFDGNGEFYETEFCWMSKADAKYYSHITVPEGGNGVWTIEDDDLEYRMPTDVEANAVAGDGFQIMAPTDTSVTILAPYEL